MTKKISKQPNEPISADVLIVGGGLAGGTLACALADGGLDVVSVDVEAPTEQLDAAYDGRASAISLTSKAVMEALGLWEDLGAQAGRMDDIRVSDGASLLFLHYDHAQIGDQPFGYMLENRQIRYALSRAIPKRQNILLKAPARVVDIDRTSSGVTAVLDDGTIVNARLIVGADGRRSQVRDSAGINLMQWSYHQTGIVCTVIHEKPHQNIAQEHFLPAGPFAILPLTDDAEGRHRSSLVWTEREDRTPAILALDDDAFLGELESRFGTFLGPLSVAGPRWAYPLTLQQASTSIDLRLALVADADHGMHPIAGQGLNMGLRDVAALAEVLTEAKRLGQDVGTADVLERYQRWRRFDNTLMLALTDALTKLFSNNIAPVRIARDLGLGAVNALTPVKKMFMKHAMGTVGDLPRLMQGKRL